MNMSFYTQIKNPFHHDYIGSCEKLSRLHIVFACKYIFVGLINRAAMGRAQFLLCTGFIFFRRFFFVGNQTQTSTRPNRDRDFGSRNLGCSFTKSCRNINVQKMLRILFSLLCIKYFFFWSHRSVGLKGNLKTLKKVLRQPWNALMLQLSL